MDIQAEFIVALTGGGLYNSGLDYNSAALLKDAFPEIIPRSGKRNIRILKMNENIPSLYGASRKLIHSLWDGNASLYDSSAEPGETVEVQLFIHMGMRTSEENYCFETFARRDGYIHPDNKEDLPSDDDVKKDGYWAGCPSELSPELNLTLASHAVQKAFPDIPSRQSTNAGHNLCEWIFYSSLAEGHKRGESLNVAFVHVPAGDSDEHMARGVLAVSKYIEELAGQVEEGQP